MTEAAKNHLMKATTLLEGGADKTFFLALNERKLKSCVWLQTAERGKYGTKAYCLEDVVVARAVLELDNGQCY